MSSANVTLPRKFAGTVYEMLTGTALVITSESSSSRTICLVDDDMSVLKAVGRLLTSAGCVVPAFSEAAPFLAYISANRVDLVVLDIWMKQITGLEVLARLCLLSPQTRIITARRDHLD